MKPNWKDAPSWAKWLAQDENGEWYWFDTKPDMYDCFWENTSLSCDAGKSFSNWQDTLEHKPNAQKNA